ncbi:MAG: hypothetical protein AAF591_16220 [Verrucomicrobiota bacterium]
MTDELGSEPVTTVEAPEVAASADGPLQGAGGGRSGCWKGVAIVAVILLVLLLGAGVWYWYYFHAGPYRPVELTEPERVELEEKIEVVTGEPVVIPAEFGDEIIVAGDAADDQSQAPERFRDRAPGAMTPEERRTIVFTEREINGFLGHNTELGEVLYIDLKPGVVVAKVVWPFEEGTPLVGGKTLRLRVTLGAATDDAGAFGLVVRDVTVSGISVPNAWLGGIKGENLVELEGEDGILGAFSAGIRDFEIANDEMRVRLRE